MGLGLTADTHSSAHDVGGGGFFTLFGGEGSGGFEDSCGGRMEFSSLKVYMASSLALAPSVAVGLMGNLMSSVSLLKDRRLAVGLAPVDSDL